MIFFNGKLSEVKLKWSLYDNELYVVSKTLKKQKHYWIGKEFILYSDSTSSKVNQ